ncbi:Uncharacterised protein [Segatella copri]|nr:Uncharacterised protein [Segatella copri]
MLKRRRLRTVFSSSKSFNVSQISAQSINQQFRLSQFTASIRIIILNL